MEGKLNHQLYTIVNSLIKSDNALETIVDGFKSLRKVAWYLLGPTGFNFVVWFHHCGTPSTRNTDLLQQHADISMAT